MELLNNILNNPMAVRLGLWAIFGIVFGAFVHVISNQSLKGGVLGSILLGMLGAIVGGTLADIILGANVQQFTFHSFVFALIGAFIFVLFQSLFLKDIKHFKTKITNLD